MNLWALLLVAVGALVVCSAIFEYDWFMQHRKARFVVGLIGRNGARVMYVFLGLAVSTLGLLMVFNVV